MAVALAPAASQVHHCHCPHLSTHKRLQGVCLNPAGHTISLHLHQQADRLPHLGHCVAAVLQEVPADVIVHTRCRLHGHIDSTMQQHACGSMRPHWVPLLAAPFCFHAARVQQQAGALSAASEGHCGPAFPHEWSPRQAGKIPGAKFSGRDSRWTIAAAGVLPKVTATLGMSKAQVPPHMPSYWQPGPPAKFGPHRHTSEAPPAGDGGRQRRWVITMDPLIL